MSLKPELKLAFCSYEAAKYACLHWHYSKSVPAGKIVKIGVWENKEFIGCVLFSRGANKFIGKPYNLEQNKVCELTRVALKSHITPVSKILSIAIKILRKQCPNLKLIVSYADTGQNHYGGIYQATNWIYVGAIDKDREYIINGKHVHRRTVSSLAKNNETQKLCALRLDPNMQVIKTSQKHKYLMPLDNEIKKAILPLSKPYPKKENQAAEKALVSVPLTQRVVQFQPRRSNK